MAKLKPNQFLLDGHIFSEIPLLFQTEMVQAVVEDRKSQTRRIKGLDYLNNPRYFKEFDSMDHVVSLDGKERHGIMLNLKREPDMGVFVKYPYGKPGDLLWVRETFTEWPKGSYQYRASTAFGDELGIWKPSIHMPKAAARIWLMVEEITVERLQDISEEDAIAEGCSSYGPFGEFRGSVHPSGGTMRYRAYSKASRAFQCIWESINAPESWKQNPWVWVVKFRTLSKTGRPSDDVIVKNWKEVSNG